MAGRIKVIKSVSSVGGSYKNKCIARLTNTSMLSAIVSQLSFANTNHLIGFLSASFYEGKPLVSFSGIVPNEGGSATNFLSYKVENNMMSIYLSSKYAGSGSLYVLNEYIVSFPDEYVTLPSDVTWIK